MSIGRVTALVSILLIVTVLLGCGASERELTMEVPAPPAVRVGENAVVQVIFRNLPEQGPAVDITWYGFGGQPQVTIGLPPATSTKPTHFKLVWVSSLDGILGGLEEPPMLFGPNGEKLRPGATEVGLNFYFRTLSAGTTELPLNFMKLDGSVIEKRVLMTVTPAL